MKIIILLISLVFFPNFGYAQINYPTEEDVTGMLKLCGAGLTVSVAVKGDIEAALKGWKNAKAEATVELAKKSLAGYLDKVKSEQGSAASLKIYTECVRDLVQKFIDANAKAPKRVSSRQFSDSLLRSSFATSAEMRQAGCTQAHGRSLATLKSECSGNLTVLASNCNSNGSTSPVTYESVLTGECHLN